MKSISLVENPYAPSYKIGFPLLMTFSRPKHSKTDAPTEDLREFMAVTRVHLFILEQYLVVKNINLCNMEYNLVFIMTLSAELPLH